MATEAAAEIVSDPVAHISISGFHGRKELEARRPMRHANAEPATDFSGVLIGVAIGAVLMYLLKR